MNEEDAQEIRQALVEISRGRRDAAGVELAAQILSILNAGDGDGPVAEALELLAEYAFAATDTDADFIINQLSETCNTTIKDVVYSDPRNERVWSLRERLSPLDEEERELRRFVRAYIPVPKNEFQLDIPRRYGNDDGGAPPPTMSPTT